MRGEEILRRGRGFCGWIVAVWVWALPWPGNAALPVPDRGEASRTVLLYNAERVPYSLADVLEMTALRLRRVAGQLEQVALASATADQLAEADYLVMLCVEPPAEFPAVVVEALSRTNLPVLWVGYGLETLGQLKPFAGTLRPAPPMEEVSATNVLYRSTLWSVPPTAWQPVALTADPANRLLMELVSGTNQVRRPLAWVNQRLTVFAALPWEGMLGHLFADLVLDYYGAQNLEPSRVFLLIEDYHPRSDHAKFQRMVDFLHGRGHPFAVAVTPVVEISPSGETADLDSSPAFVQSLRYAQQRGGRLVVKGFLKPWQETGAFWDFGQDRPLALDQPGYARERLERAVQQLREHELFPLAWRTPGDAASQTAYREIARTFSTTLGRLQLSDATAAQKHTASCLTRNRFGCLVLPENLGFVVGEARDPWSSMRSRALNILRLRQTLAGCSFHAYLPFDQFLTLMKMVEEWGQPFLDLMDLDNRVEWPGEAILTGRARAEISKPRGPVTWSAWDRQLQPVESRSSLEWPGPGETGAAGRLGKGALEVFQFGGTTGEVDF